jgi:hypothetical protein
MEFSEFPTDLSNIKINTLTTRKVNNEILKLIDLFSTLDNIIYHIDPNTNISEEENLEKDSTFF